MNELQNSLDTLQGTLSQILLEMLAYLPKLMSALLLLLLGGLLAVILRRLSRAMLARLDRYLRRLHIPRLGTPLAINARTINVIATLIFWLVLLVFIAAATQVSGLDIFTQWLGSLIAYLPTVLAGLLIIAAGYIFSLILRDLTIAAASSMHISQAVLLGRLTQFAILAIALVLGIAQIGIDVSFLTALITVLVGVFGAGLALAFALGAKDLVGSVLAMRYVREQLREGDQIRIGEMEGRILEFTHCHIIIQLESGHTYLPAAEFLRNNTSLLLRADHAPKSD